MDETQPISHEMLATSHFSSILGSTPHAAAASW
jgi:hypothetical protein